MKETAEDILRELEGLAHDRTKSMLMRNHGIPEPCFGVRIGDMKPIVRRIGKDHRLALDLFATGNYDAMYLAGLIADDERMNRRDLQRWASKALHGCLPGTTVPSVATGSRHGRHMALEWIESPREHVVVAGWSTLALMVAVKEDAELDLEELGALLERVEDTIGEAPDMVRYAMNQFVISLGCHVAPLSGAALEAGRRMGPIEADLGNNRCRIPYAPDYILKVGRMGRIGKKRRKAKC